MLHVRALPFRRLLSRSLIVFVALFLVVSLSLHHLSTRPRAPVGGIDWRANQAGTWETALRGAKVGSEAWLARYPAFEHGPTPRDDWLARLYRVKAEGLIVGIPKATLNGGLADYPSDLTMNDHVCSYRRTGCIAPDDVWRGPGHTWAINYDDGPLPPSAALHRFLDEQQQYATHFWVGYNVKSHWQLAVEAAQRGDHLAVHTWSHPHLTTYTDEQIVGELGWTMQIIYDISGHLPKYLRPPFGDTDARVRSIAKHVFGLTTALWNHDSFDWSLNQTYAKGDYIDPPMDWLTTQHSIDRLIERASASQDEGVITLEHELSNESVEAFVKSFPVVRENGWKTGAIPELMGLEWYQ